MKAFCCAFVAAAKGKRPPSRATAKGTTACEVGENAWPEGLWQVTPIYH